jgi:hypothetical protein
MIKINGTSGITNVDGTAASPALTGADTDTGVFTGTDIVGISTGGTERVRVDASGNVGIGTSSPASTQSGLDISSGGLSLVVGANNNGSARTNNATKTSRIASYHYTNAEEPVGLCVIDSTSTSNVINFGGSSGIVNAATTISFWTAANNTTTTGSERARIDSSGNLLVGKTATTFTTDGVALSSGGSNFSLTSATLIALNRNGTNGNVIDFYKAGTSVGSISVTTTNTTYSTSSDYRLKENIAPLQNALATVTQLNPVTYTWKVDGSAGQGFIAHELQEVVPDCVTGEKDAVDEEGNPQYQGVDTSFLVGILTAAIKELKSELDAAKARIEQLEQA